MVLHWLHILWYFSLKGKNSNICVNVEITDWLLTNKVTTYDFRDLVIKGTTESVSLCHFLYSSWLALGEARHHAMCAL
jgi:hypothetical protein